MFERILSIVRRSLLVASAVFFLIASDSARGADSAESEKAFLNAIGSFQLGFWDRAAKEFDAFVTNFPDSAKVSDAILRRAQSLFNMGKYVAVDELLAAHAGQAGELADRFQFLQADAQMKQQFYARASKIYEGLLASFPKSSLRLEASYGQAKAISELKQLDRAIALLSETNGVFQVASKTSTNEVAIVDGNLLLAESLFAQKRFRDAENVLKELGKRPLKPQDEWNRLYLFASSAFADLRSDEALTRVTNLVVHSTSASGKPVNHANALMLKAEIVKEKDPNAAIAIYEEISKISGVLASQARQAVFKMIQVILGQNQVPNAIQKLDKFVSDSARDTNAPPFDAIDLIRSTLGELHLKQFREVASKVSNDAVGKVDPSVTNSLVNARIQFDIIINSLTNSPNLGEAYLNRGWCFWEEALLTGRLSTFDEGQASFQAAVERLPVSEKQAIARFKWADCQFRRKEYSGAVENYRFLIENYGHLPNVKSSLFDQVLNHIIEASIDAADFGGAKDALDKTLAWFPESSWTERSLLTYGQELLDHGQARGAREALLDFEQRFPKSDSIPEARLVRAETFAAERNWTNAIGEYDSWVASFTNHALLPQAEFDRARIYDRAGEGSKALSLFTNYVARFAGRRLAPLAQYWVASYHFNQRDYLNAERNYQLLRNTNSNPSELGYRAWLKAGQSALLREKPSDARPYLTNLVLDPGCPDAVKAEALFSWGEVELLDASSSDPTNQMIRFHRAGTKFSQILTNFPSSRFVPLAQGKLGNCFFQLGEFEKAKAAYQKVIESPLADVDARGQAEVAIATILEKQAAQKVTLIQQVPLLTEALEEHLLNVVFAKGLRPGELDPFWLKEAGMLAGELAERLGKTEQAIKIYQLLQNELPPELLELQAAIAQRLTVLKAKELPDTRLNL